ncbi:MAG TPA: hypothetical protein VLW17_07415 [Thermoanaerobaculaceae bacterium]|nr:hypothetical protein [Thermoanaerobaculaceae bacterium]
MEEHQAIVAELEQMREGAAALMRARLDTAANQVRELAARVAGDLGVVIPPDLETLFPLGAMSGRLAELAKPAPVPPAVTLELLRRLDAGRAQSEVLQELLRQLEPFCGPRGIVVFRDGQAAGWAGAGFAAGDPVRGWRGALADSAALARVAQGAPALASSGGDGVLTAWLGADVHLLLVPMSLRGKVVGALLAAEGGAGLDTVTVQHLTFTAGLLLETLNARPTVPTAALLEPVDLTAVAPAAPEPEPVFAAPAEEEPLPLEQPTIPPGEAMPEADAGATAQIRIPVAPVAPPPPPPVAVRSPEEERKHEEAKRFARLLVSEIRLYNEPAVQTGKASRDIYQRLKEDIDRSREMYEQRVGADVRAHSNYFFDELVRILADGDQAALGL